MPRSMGPASNIWNLTTMPLFVIDDLDMRNLALAAAEELLKIVMRRQ